MPDPIPLAHEPAPPKLRGTVALRSGVDEVVDAMAADLFLHANACVRAFGDFHLALSGGTTPLPLYTRLMYDPNMRSFPWPRTHLWMVDERRVPFDDERCNFTVINEIIGEHSGIPPEQVHPIFALADDADLKYQELLQSTLGWREKGQDRLDYALLGVGADGHVASLFPGSPALRDPDREPRLVRLNTGPTVTPPDRVTMTMRLINASRFIAVMVTGEGKRRIVSRVAAAQAGTDLATPDDLPILGVRPIGGELRWYLDHAAADAGTGEGPAEGARD